MTFFGDDIDCGPEGLSPTFDLVSERPALVQALFRRYQTRRSTLVDDPNYGLDVQAWVAKRITSGALLAAWQQELANEARKDERVLDARARVTFDDVAGRMVFTVAGVTAEGPFSLSVSVSEVSVDLLSAS